MKLQILELAEQVHRRTHRPSTQEITNERIAFLPETPSVEKRPMHGVEVEQCLRGMLILATATVEDGHTASGGVEQIGHVLAESGLGIAHHDAVEVAAEDPHPVLLTLPLVFGRKRGVAHFRRVYAHELAGGEKGKEGPRGRLREVEHRLLMLQNGLEEAATVGFAGDFLDEVRSVEQFLHQRFLKLLGEHDVVEPSLPDIVRHPCFRRLPEVVFKGKQRCSHGRKLRGFTAFPMVGSAGRTVQRLIQY